jgi:hypothetical protein
MVNHKINEIPLSLDEEVDNFILQKSIKDVISSFSPALFGVHDPIEIEITINTQKEK